MADGLPYFKFVATHWLTGDIVYETFQVQGLFINICALYWQRDGNVTIDDINKRYKNPEELKTLLQHFISEKDGKISIEFLDEQLHERGHISAKNSVNGSKGGAAKALKTKECLAVANQTVSEILANNGNIEEEKKRKEKNKNKKRKEFIAPSLIEFENYFKENNFPTDLAQRAWKGYSVAGWYDTKGNKILNWKQKCQNVWFKDENKNKITNAEAKTLEWGQ